MNKELLLVDRDDNIIGYEKKNIIHQKGLLHRAFSIFFYDKKNKLILLQKRALSKYHSGGLWSNTCCSHPYKNEDINVSIQRCIKDELNIDLAINNFNCKYLGKFYYYSKYNQHLFEHEIDYVYICYVDSNTISIINFNKNEISKLKWVEFNKINELYNNNFTSWFNDAYDIVRKYLS